MLRFEDLPEPNSKRWLSIEDLPDEEWRDVPEFEDRFEISSYGRLRRKQAVVFTTNNKVRVLKPIIIKQHVAPNGYCVCSKRIVGRKTLNKGIHRLVAELFIPNPQNLPNVNHKDENKQNNCVYNLEWCTCEYNSNYGTRTERLTRTKIEKGQSVPVILYSYDGEVINSYDTAKEASRKLCVSIVDILMCCKGDISSAKGYHFRYKGDVYTKRKMLQIKNVYKVYKDDKLLFETFQTKEVCKNLGLSYNSFRRFLSGKTKYSAELTNRLIGYTILVDSQLGYSFKIINGKKIYI